MDDTDEMIGKVFGRLTVSRLVSQGRRGGNIVYECVCCCGKVTNVAKKHLITGHSKSCGCLSGYNIKELGSQAGSWKRIIPTIGEIHNMLTVVADLGSIQGQTLVRCICICGKETEIAYTRFRKGHVKSCGCLGSLRHRCRKFTIQVGDVSHNLTVTDITPVPTGHANYGVTCLCVCGNRVIVDPYKIRHKLAKSCGCLTSKYIADSVTTHGHCKNYRNGKIEPEYACWGSMIARCTNTNNVAYKHYGGRGIKIHPSWKTSFESFLLDVGPRPSPEYSLDRIDVNGNYEPENVRWATREEQAFNKRNSKMLTFQGETHTVGYWAWKYKIDINRVKANLALGLTPYEAVFLGYPQTKKRREKLNWDGCNDKKIVADSVAA